MAQSHDEGNVEGLHVGPLDANHSTGKSLQLPST